MFWILEYQVEINFLKKFVGVLKEDIVKKNGKEYVTK